MQGKFQGKRALITGGGGGIGREIVLLLKRNGADVVIIDRSKTELEALKKEIECDTIVADLSNAEQAKKAAERALPVDLLVNCAGVNNLQPFLDYRGELRRNDQCQHACNNDRFPGCCEEHDRTKARRVHRKYLEHRERSRIPRSYDILHL